MPDLESCDCLTFPNLTVVPSIAAYDAETGDLVWTFRGGDGVPAGDYVWVTCRPHCRIDSTGNSVEVANHVPGPVTLATAGNPPETNRANRGNVIGWPGGAVVAPRGRYLTHELAPSATGSGGPFLWRLSEFDGDGFQSSADVEMPLNSFQFRPAFSYAECFLPAILFDGTLKLYRLNAGDDITLAVQPSGVAAHPTSDLLAVTNIANAINIRDWAGSLNETITGIQLASPGFVPDGTLFALGAASQVLKIAAPYDAVTDSITLTAPGGTYNVPTTLIPHPDGFLFVISGHGGLLPLARKHFVTRVNADMSEVWSVELPLGSPVNAPQHFILATCLADEALFVMLRSGANGRGSIHRVDPDGSLAWTRELRAIGPGLIRPIQAVYHVLGNQIIVSGFYEGLENWTPVD